MVGAGKAAGELPHRPHLAAGLPDQAHQSRKYISWSHEPARGGPCWPIRRELLEDGADPEARRADGGGRRRRARPRRCSRSSRNRGCRRTDTGEICRLKSAETHVVVCANMHSPGDLRRLREDGDQASRHAQLRIGRSQVHQRGDHALAVGSGSSRSSDTSPDLRRVQAHPDLSRVRILRPDSDELLEIAVTLRPAGASRCSAP